MHYLGKLSNNFHTFFYRDILLQAFFLGHSILKLSLILHLIFTDNISIQ